MIAFEDLKLKLAFLKENFRYQETFKMLKDWRASGRDSQGYLEAWADFKTEFDLWNVTIMMTGEHSQKIFDILDPDENEIEVEEKYLRGIFHNTAVSGVRFNHDDWSWKNTEKGISYFKSHKSLTIWPFELLQFGGLDSDDRLFRVNLNAKRKVIIEEFERLLDIAIAQNTDAGWAEDKSRKRKETAKHLECWKLRKAGMPFADIAMALKITPDAAKKSFYSAFELIHEKPYNKGEWKNQLRHVLEIEARTKRPADTAFWEKAAKAEEGYQAEGLHLEDGAFEDDAFERGDIISDLRKICAGCPDSTCRKKNLSILADCEAGDKGAIENLSTDCPKILDYFRM